MNGSEKMKKGIIVITAIFVLVCAMKVQPVMAIPTLWLSDDGGSTWATAVDNETGDGNPLAGVVLFNNPVGNWIVNVATGVTMPVLGSAASPHMDLGSINVFFNPSDTDSSGTLLIGLSEDGFGPVDGWLTSSFGGVTSGTVEFATGINSIDPDAWISSFGPFTGAFSGSTGAAVSLSPDDTLWLGASITHAAGGVGNTSFNYEVQVPEPGTFLLFGSSLIGLAFFRRRK